jgi:hypothetical protein
LPAQYSPSSPHTITSTFAIDVLHPASVDARETDISIGESDVNVVEPEEGFLTEVRVLPAESLNTASM